jgi:hypothetical protein
MTDLKLNGNSLVDLLLAATNEVHAEGQRLARAHVLCNHAALLQRVEATLASPSASSASTEELLETVVGLRVTDRHHVVDSQADWSEADFAEAAENAEVHSYGTRVRMRYSSGKVALSIFAIDGAWSNSTYGSRSNAPLGEVRVCDLATGLVIASVVYSRGTPTNNPLCPDLQESPDIASAAMETEGTIHVLRSLADNGLIADHVVKDGDTKTRATADKFSRRKSLACIQHICRLPYKFIKDTKKRDISCDCPRQPRKQTSAGAQQWSTCSELVDYSILAGKVQSNLKRIAKECSLVGGHSSAMEALFLAKLNLLLNHFMGIHEYKDEETGLLHECDHDPTTTVSVPCEAYLKPIRDALNPIVRNSHRLFVSNLGTVHTSDTEHAHGLRRLFAQKDRAVPPLEFYCASKLADLHHNMFKLRRWGDDWLYTTAIVDKMEALMSAEEFGFVSPIFRQKLQTAAKRAVRRADNKMKPVRKAAEQSSRRKSRHSKPNNSTKHARGIDLLDEPNLHGQQPAPQPLRKKGKRATEYDVAECVICCRQLKSCQRKCRRDRRK